MDELKNIELVKLCLEGHQNAQQQLYEMYIPYVYTICRRYNVTESEIMDVIQDIFSGVFTSLNKFDKNRGYLKGWIRSIAINKVIDHRKKKRPPSIEIETCIDLNDKELNGLQNLFLEDILDIIRTMPEGYQLIFNMYMIDGFSHKEIANILNISIGTSKSQFSRAKKWLRLELDQIRKSEYPIIEE